MQHLLSELGYMGLEVSDLSRWQLFANDVLGLSATPGPLPKTCWLRMDEYRYRFILREGPADDCIFVGWKTANPAAVEAFGKHLDTHGVEWQWGSAEELKLRSVQRMLHFQDPAGNRHEAYCGPMLATDRFVSPKVPGGFVTRGEGLGHIVYSSGAYQETLEFAGRVLGLSATDQIRLDLAPGISFEVSFLHTNARHHSFALAPQPPGPGPHKQIHHFMIEVTHVEEVGFARDRCLAMGQAVHMDIGQHPNDRMISFYGQTPSGIFRGVRLGWDQGRREMACRNLRPPERMGPPTESRRRGETPSRLARGQLHRTSRRAALGK